MRNNLQRDPQFEGLMNQRNRYSGPKAAVLGSVPATGLDTTMKHFLSMIDLSTETITQLLTESARLKAAHARRIPASSLCGRVVGLIFEKPSLRTRVSFESGIAQL